MDAPDFNEDVRSGKVSQPSIAKPNISIMMMPRQFGRRLIPLLQQSTQVEYCSKRLLCVVISERLLGMGFSLSVSTLPLALRYEQGTAGPLIVERLNVNSWIKYTLPNVSASRLRRWKQTIELLRALVLCSGENIAIGQWRFEPRSKRLSN